MTNQIPSRIAGTFEIISTGAAFGMVLIACLVLAGWSLDIAVLKSFHVGVAPMGSTAAVACLLAGISLWLSQESRTRPRANRAKAMALALVVLVVGLLPMLEYFSESSFGIDQLFYREPTVANAAPSHGRMAPTTALTLVLTGLSLMLLDVRKQHGHRPVLYLAGLGGLVTSVALVGYVYGAPQLYAPVVTSYAMSFPGVIAGNLAFLGIWLARSESVWLAILIGDRAGSTMARRLLLPLLMVPIALDATLLVGQNAGFYDYHMESSIHVVLTMLVFIPFVFIAARSLNTAEAGRLQAEFENARLATIVETSEDAILSKNLEATIQSWNPAAERVFGYRAEEIVRKSIALILLPEYVQEEEDILLKLIHGERIEHFETVRVTKSGRRIDVSATISTLMDADGRMIGVSKIIRDFSLRKHAEARSRLLAAALQASASATAIAIAIAGRDGNIQWINAAFMRLTGYSAEEAAGMNPHVLKSGKQNKAFYQQMWETILAGSVWRGELVNKRKDGSLFSEELTITPVIGTDGRITHFIAVKQDITERKEAEEALRLSNARLHLLAEVASDLLRSNAPKTIVNSLCLRVLAFLDCQAFLNFLVDEGKGRLHLNNSAGISDEEARRIEWLDYGEAVCGCAARDTCRVVVEKIQTTLDPSTEMIKAFGMQAYACHPLIVGKRLLGTLSFGTRTRTCFDDDEISLMKAVADQVAIAIEGQRAEEALRLAAENLERSNRDLEQFAYVASHDLQEPLRAVAGYTQLLQSRYPAQIDDKALQYIAGAAEGATRMQTLIHDLLAFSCVCIQVKSFEPTNLNTVVARALDNLAISIQEASPQKNLQRPSRSACRSDPDHPSIPKPDWQRDQVQERPPIADIHQCAPGRKPVGPVGAGHWDQRRAPILDRDTEELPP